MDDQFIVERGVGYGLYKRKLYQQLSIDYCCQVSDIKDDKNYFMEYEKLEGRWRGWN